MPPAFVLSQDQTLRKKNFLSEIPIQAIYLRLTLKKNFSRFTPVYKHLVNNYLSHYRRQYAQYLHCEYRYEYLYELLLEFKYRRNEPLEAEED